MIRMVDKICSFAGLLFLPSLLFAQVDTLCLKGIEVVATTMQNDMAAVEFEKLTPKDALLCATSTLNNLLTNRTNLVLRGYGPGSSFGVSIRGSSTSQTQVMLNGVPFENPGLATTDVSLLANGLASQVSIYRGSGSAYLGNASVGGSILLNSEKPNLKESISQNFSYGSFGSFGSLTTATYGKKRFAGTTKIYFKQAENDFLRVDPRDRTAMEPQPNAAFKTKGLAQDFYFYSKGATSARVFVWASETDRHIPPVKSRPYSDKSQKDQSFRAQAIVSTSVKSVDLKFNTAVDYGFLNYKDPDSQLDENSNYTTFHFQAEARRDFGKTHVFLFGIFRDSYVLTEQYTGTEQRLSPAIVGGANRTFWSGRTRVSVLIRQEFLNTTALPVIPVFSLSQKLSTNLHLDFSAGRAYRLPGLNDLYWVPGGNPELLPESGWFEEGGLNYTTHTNRVKVEAKISAFHRVIDNWIQWIPGSDYWSPQNVNQVLSRGFDGSLEIIHPAGRLSFDHSVSATFAKSTSLEPMFLGDKSVDKQLIYIPVWSAFAKEEIGFDDNKYSIAFLGKYFSERYTTADNSRGLDPYFLVDVEGTANFSLKNISLSVFAAARNIFDVQYQLQAAYPMPGIYFESGIKFNFNLNTKSK